MPLYKPDHLSQYEWLVERFWQGVDKREPNECWPWKKARVTDGYGTVAFWAGYPVATHRLSYEIHKGKIPPKTQVMHTCDNPPCCNPTHLVLGTPRDNAIDMLKKGRNPQQKLVPDQIRNIREDKRKHRIIAEEYKISESLVSLIKAGKRWPEEMLVKMES
jgi:hypothetical protein